MCKTMPRLWVVSAIALCWLVQTAAVIADDAARAALVVPESEPRPGPSMSGGLDLANFNDSAILSYRAWDQTQGIKGKPFDLTGQLGGTKAFSTAAESATQTVLPVNDAPVLKNSGNPALTAIFEDVAKSLTATAAPVWNEPGR